MKKKIVLVAAIVSAIVLTVGASAMASDTNAISVTANVVGTCKFSNPTSALNISADPSSGADATGTVSLGFTCTNGASFSFAQNAGLHTGTAGALGGTLYVSNGTTNIPYTISASPATGTGTGFGNAAQSTTITGTIVYADYQNATAGAYLDTVTVTINP